jgi:hypothetical protein
MSGYLILWENSSDDEIEYICRSLEIASDMLNGKNSFEDLPPGVL